MKGRPSIKTDTPPYKAGFKFNPERGFLSILFTAEPQSTLSLSFLFSFDPAE
jgi:hypothetical protein